MWALLLMTVMAAGVVAVLLLNTAMQQQSVRLTAQQHDVTRLQLRAQALQTGLQRAADPAVLDSRARRLRMRPASRVSWATVHARPRAASRGRAG